MYGIIYKAVSPDGKVYIGKTIMKFSEKIKCHESQALRRPRPFPFHAALLQYGRSAFKWEIIGKAKNEKELNRKKAHWIVHYNSADPEYGYNAVWGDGIPNREACRKMSAARKGTRMSETGRLNMCRAVARLAPETVRAIREHLGGGGSLMGTAKFFGVGKSTIAAIKSGRRYVWVTV
jgi:hypothetical protein